MLLSLALFIVEATTVTTSLTQPTYSAGLAKEGQHHSPTDMTMYLQICLFAQHHAYIVEAQTLVLAVVLYSAVHICGCVHTSHC